MNNQESMFQTPEYPPPREQPYNAGLHEQHTRSQYREAPGEEGYQGYSERETPYIDDGMRQINDGKIRPQRPYSRRKNWIVALAVGLPLLFLIALGGMGSAFGQRGGWRSWDGGRNGYRGVHSGDMRGHPAAATQLFQVGAQPTLIIKNADRTVHIHTGDAGQVVVASQGFNSAGDGSGGAQSNYDSQSNIVNIDAQNQFGDRPNFPFGNDSDLEITAPANSNIRKEKKKKKEW